MTVREKAEYLVNKFTAIQEQIEWTKDKQLMELCGERNDELGDEGEYYWKQLAKQSAIIAVDEVLNLGLHDVGDYRNDQASSDDFSTVTWYINYWQEVKQHIEQL